MNICLETLKTTRKLAAVILSLLLASCAESETKTETSQAQSEQGSNVNRAKVIGGTDRSKAPTELFSQILTNKISVTDGVIQSAYFLDKDPLPNLVSGRIVLELKQNIGLLLALHQEHRIYLVDEYDERLGTHVFSGNMSKHAEFEVSEIEIPEGGKAKFEIVAVNLGQEAESSVFVRFHDKKFEKLITGPGGNYDFHWRYGEQRPELEATEQAGFCFFDNGVVSVINMNGDEDHAWINLPSPRPANVADEQAFPAYSFDCSQTNEQDADLIEDEYGVWTYSSINDAMHYGNLIYQTLTQALREPPLEEKLRFRVHYDHQGAAKAFWDGAYVNLSDGKPFYYSLTQLDVMAHEIAHGVLIRISNLGEFGNELSNHTFILHEAFADLTGVYVKHMTGSPNVWLHTETPYGFFARELNKIRTEYDAIPSYLDFDELDKNKYLGIGLMTYPFYLLAQEYGIEGVYQLYINAARTCWQSEHELPDIAACLYDLSEFHEIEPKQVIKAFQAVKISLVPDQLLSHFKYTADQLTVTFNENAQPTNTYLTYRWDFGDGHYSDLLAPQHTYQEQGEYQVRLTVTNREGKSDSFSRHVIVNVK